MKTIKQQQDEYYNSEMKKFHELQSVLIGGFSIVAIIALCIMALILFK